MLLGELAALGTAFSWSGTAVFFSYSGGRIGSDVVNRSRLLFALLFLLLSHFLLQGVWFPLDAEPFRWFWLTISSILGLVLGDTFLFRAFVMLGPRLSTLMMALVPILGAALDWLLFGETLTGLEMAGILLTVGGVTWVVTERQPTQTLDQNREYKKGLWYGLLGAVGQVANLATAKYALVDGFSTISATLIRIIVAALILWLLTAFRGQIRYTIGRWREKRALAALVAGSFVGPFLGIWLSIIAISLAPLGIASTLMALPPVILIPVEYVLYKKPVSRRGITGTLLAIGGVALLFLPQ